CFSQIEFAGILRGARNEEGARWGAGFTGSRALTGQLEPEELESRVDDSGLTEAQAMRMVGLHPDRLTECARIPGSIAAYIEPHIEQGPVLESLGIPLGTVTGIVGLAWLTVTLSGQASHAGAMPMRLRRDALAGAAEIILGIEGAARSTDGVAVATVGKIEVSPGATNVVPGQVRFTVDCRSMAQEAIEELAGRVKSLAGDVAARRGLHAHVAAEHSCSPVDLSSDVVELLAESAAAVGAPFHRLHSGAAHDAMNIAAIAPAGMLFIRSVGGISHSPDEASEPEDLALAAAVLEEALARLARIDTAGMLPELRECRVTVACDVDNPLVGPEGASAVFGPQKGATPEMVEVLYAALRRFAEVVERDLGVAVADLPGAGAAGGLGAGAVAFLRARLRRGVEMVIDAVRLADKLRGADLVLSGEGRSDHQTLRGKTPYGVARVACRLGIPVILLAGSLGEGVEALFEHGVVSAFSIVDGPMTLEQAMARAPELMASAAERAVRAAFLHGSSLACHTSSPSA
ncbi:MAG: hydantoinase/carbamoylase family amidase, partial [Alicyclobacillus sp.]|nr:hydantoinase/carbamoylase family amidase [Alicyclobacillus sp.]